MNILHLFIFFIFVVGILLIILNFNIYSKLTDECNSKDLRTKLRFVIGLGTTFVTIAIGYTICINKSGCDCDFEKSNWKNYSILVALILLGGGLLALTIEINNDIKSNLCDIDFGIIPDILIGLSIAQIIIPSFYIFYIMYKNKKDNKDQDQDQDEDEDKDKNKNKDKDKDEYEDDESAAQIAESNTNTTNKIRLDRYKKRIAEARDQLSTIQNKLEDGKGKLDKETKIKYKKEAASLTNQIEIYINDANKINIGSSGSSSSSGSSNSIGSSGSIGSIGSIGSSGSSGSNSFIGF